LLGATYEPKQVAFLLKGMAHVIDKPRKVTVQEDAYQIRVIQVIDLEKRHQLLSFT
jgi:hypothetical protein